MQPLVVLREVKEISDDGEAPWAWRERRTVMRPTNEVGSYGSQTERKDDVEHRRRGTTVTDNVAENQPAILET